MSGRSRASGARSPVSLHPAGSRSTRTITSPPPTSPLLGRPRTGSSGCGVERRACWSPRFAGGAGLWSHRRLTAPRSCRPSQRLSESRWRDPSTTSRGRSRRSPPSGRRLRSELPCCERPGPCCCSGFSDDRRRLTARGSRLHLRGPRSMFRTSATVRRDSSTSPPARRSQSPRLRSIFRRDASRRATRRPWSPTGDGSSARPGGRPPRRRPCPTNPSAPRVGLRPSAPQGRPRS